MCPGRTTMARPQAPREDLRLEQVIAPSSRLPLVFFNRSRPHPIPSFSSVLWSCFVICPVRLYVRFIPHGTSPLSPLDSKFSAPLTALSCLFHRPRRVALQQKIPATPTPCHHYYVFASLDIPSCFSLVCSFVLVCYSVRRTSLLLIVSNGPRSSPQSTYTN